MVHTGSYVPGGDSRYGSESDVSVPLPLSTYFVKDWIMPGQRSQESDSMSQNLRQSISELEARAKQYEVAAAKSRQAAQQLRELLQLDAPKGSSVKVSAPPAAKKPTSKAKPKRNWRPLRKPNQKQNPSQNPPVNRPWLSPSRTYSIHGIVKMPAA